MSNLKCPFCGGELYGCIGHPYCRNEKCEMCDEIMPQELLDLLDRTRKALDLAVHSFNEICAGVPSDIWVFDEATKAINEIKQLIKEN